MARKVWDEITYPFLNCWSLGMNKKFHPTLYSGYNYLSMLVKGATGCRWGQLVTLVRIQLSSTVFATNKQWLACNGWPRLVGDRSECRISSQTSFQSKTNSYYLYGSWNHEQHIPKSERSYICDHTALIHSTLVTALSIIWHDIACNGAIAKWKILLYFRLIKRHCLSHHHTKLLGVNAFV